MIRPGNALLSRACFGDCFSYAPRCPNRRQSGPAIGRQSMSNPEQSAAPLSLKTIQASKEFLLGLEEPIDWDKRVRWLRLSGWCVAVKGMPVESIQATLRGKVYLGLFNRERPDVANHLQMPTAPRLCGFSVMVRVPPGKSVLELKVARADKQLHRVFTHTVHGTQFMTRRDEEREHALVSAKDHYDFWFDQPLDWTQPTSTLHISGWCVNRGGEWIDGIRARLRNQTVEGGFGFPRKDVADAYPNLASARTCGFAITVRQPPGKSTLVLELKKTDGTWRAFFAQEICGGPSSGASETLTAAEAAYSRPDLHPPGFELWFDRPTDWDNLGADTQISGWCVPTRGDSISEMRARVGSKIVPVTYGLPRPATALMFEGYPNALKSGFAGEIRTPRGPSTFALEGRIEDGSWRKLFRRRIKGPLFPRRRSDLSERVGNYAEWIRLYDTIRDAERQKILNQINQFSHHPLFSVLLPVHNTDPKWLRRAIESVRDQLYKHWELCIVDDGSSDSGLWRIIQDFVGRDAQIKAARRSETGHICVTSNEALAMATGEFIVLLDHDDELAPTALYHAAYELNRRPDLQLIYSDEDKLDSKNRRCQPHFKSDWNPDLFTAQNFISHMGIYATNLVREVGGFRKDFEGAQDYDLALRCIERINAEQIAHLPYVLYHWRMTDQSTAASAGAKPYTLEAAARAMREHLARTSTTATVEPSREIYLRIKYPPPIGNPFVSIIIPTRDRVELLRRLVETIFSKTEYSNYQLIIVDNESAEKAAIDFLNELRGDNRVLIERVAGPFNFSKLNNIGVSRAPGDFVALLNNDLEVINGDWLTEMLSHAIRPGIGTVGARLWYPDGTLQHGGVILGFGGVAGHIHGGTREDDGYFSRQHLTQNLSAVTAACMLIRKSVYLEMNGLNEDCLAVTFNDVDFCLRLRRAGYRIVWTPYAEFLHHESASRGIEDSADKQRRFFSEEKYMREKWRDSLLSDPFYNPNLSLETQLFTLSFPPRVQKPWEAARHTK